MGPWFQQGLMERGMEARNEEYTQLDNVMRRKAQVQSTRVLLYDRRKHNVKGRGMSSSSKGVRATIRIKIISHHKLICLNCRGLGHATIN